MEIAYEGELDDGWEPAAMFARLYFRDSSGRRWLRDGSGRLHENLGSADEHPVMRR